MPDDQLEALTTTGPYAGTLTAFTTGTRLRTRYQDLLSLAKSQRPTVTFWASDSPRVIDTARHFASGFFGLNWQDKAARLEVISEASELGADTLTPGDTCILFRKDVDEGHDKGYVKLKKFQKTYMPSIRDRLEIENPGTDFSNDDIYAMQELCGFEITVRGSSQWCDVFTRDDFLAFEYARDVLHYYRAGPGTPYSEGMGWLWLNATTNLMLQGPDAGPLFFSL
jgi:acid phosphatase